MAELKKSLSNLAIGSLLTIMAWVGGLWDFLTAPAAATPGVARVAPAPQTTADWLWWQVVWWLVPVAVVVLIVAMVRGGKSKAGRVEKEPDWFSRWLAMSQQPAAQPKADEGPPAVRWLTAKEAINASTDRKWVLGQAVPQQPNQEAVRAIGQLFVVDYQTTQFAILGGSGGGKTSSTGLMMLIYCKMFGLHPIVLDGKDGLDWGPLGDMGIVEWYSLTPDNLNAFLMQLNAIYKERHTIMRQAGVSKIYELPVNRRPAPLFVIIEEFGRTWERVAHDAEIGMLFNDLFCLGRAAGIVLCPIDQAPSEWTKAMRSNAKTAICYPSQGDALKAFGEHYMSKLPQVGVFSRGNVFYRSWYFGRAREIRQLPRIQRRYLREQLRTADVREVFVSTEGSAFTRDEHLRTFVANTHTNTPSGDTKWETWIAEYAVTHPGVLADPPRGIRALSRAMSVHETGSDEKSGRYVGIASDTCRMLRCKA